MPKTTHNIFTLANGLTVTHLPLKSTQLVHSGLFINTGSRDETIVNSGVAHFIEHALFKGTKKRKASQLFNRIESVGGELNAYTTREMTAYYASSLKRHADRSFDLLSDMCFNSLLETKELDKERKVIFEEIEMYEDSPEDSIYDDFFIDLFPDHSLGYNILGTKKSLAGLGNKELRGYLNQQYQPSNMVFSVVGNISPAKVERLANEYLDNPVPKSEVVARKSPGGHKMFNKQVDKDFQQTHCILGGRAYGRHHPKRYALMLLNNILGGQNMGSRLNLSVREKHGYCYHISSTYQSFHDTGVFFIGFGCDDKNIRKTLAIIKKELALLRNKKLGPLQLNKAKRQLEGALAMASENPGVQMQSMAKGLLNYNRLIDLQELFSSIGAVTADELLEVANEIMTEDQLSSIIYTSSND